MLQLKTSQRGINLIKEFEGLQLKAYLCPAGIPTIGYGHTGSDVYIGRTISEAEAERLLKKDLARFEKAVSDLVQVPITQSQFDALVSFVYNIGDGAFEESTMLALLNKKRHEAAGDQLLNWVYASGKVLPGLQRRRQAERKLYYGQPFIR